MSALNGKILVGFMLVIGTVVLAQTSDVRLPANNRGYEPKQPIAYSHRLHAGGGVGGLFPELDDAPRVVHPDRPEVRDLGLRVLQLVARGRDLGLLEGLVARDLALARALLVGGSYLGERALLGEQQSRA